MANSIPGSLPYTDTKPVGSADFYFAINSTFRFILHRLGRDGWIRYLTDLGTGYYAPVNTQRQQGGLSAVAGYWRAIFAAEPGGEVEVKELSDRVELHVKVCRLIKHLRARGRACGWGTATFPCNLRTATCRAAAIRCSARARGASSPRRSPA